MIKIEKNQKGVSMVALILTVVVLIILCGIVLTYVLGDNGLLKGAVRGRIMNRVQTLDDTIKAYSIKNDDRYSAKRKSISELIEKGILAKIQLSDDRTIYYVSNPGLQLLGLKFRGNEFNINPATIYDEEELKQKGIYVVDNSLNAAYLDDGQVYGKLIDYGVDLDIDAEGMYNGHVLNIKPQQITNAAQEVIVVLDCTSSMLETVTGNSEDGSFALNHSDTLAGYNATRWGETVSAMDALVDSYLVEGNTLKRLTIIKYNGKYSPYNVISTYNITSNADAKSVYKNVFTAAHYNALCKAYSGSTTRLDNGINNSFYTRQGLSSVGLGHGTCTPEALRQTIQYIETVQGNNIPLDVIIMTDGQSNQTGNADSDKNKINEYARQIKSYNVGGRPVGLYAVGLSSEVGLFKQAFEGVLTFEGDDKTYYSASQSGELAGAFTSIINHVNNEETTIITTGKLKDKYENVVEVLVEVYSAENKSQYYKSYDFKPDNGIYDLDRIYQNNEVNLQYLFDIMDNDPTITDDYDTYDVWIMYK